MSLGMYQFYQFLLVYISFFSQNLRPIWLFFSIMFLLLVILIILNFCARPRLALFGLDLKGKIYVSLSVESKTVKCFLYAFVCNCIISRIFSNNKTLLKAANIASIAVFQVDNLDFTQLIEQCSKALEIPVPDSFNKMVVFRYFAMKHQVQMLPEI